MSRTTRTTRTLRASGAAALALTLLLGASACGGDAEAEADGKPVLRVGVQKDGIRAVLEQSGQLDDLDYEIEFAEFTAGPPIVEAAAADQIDVAWVGSTPPIFGAAAGADFKIVAAVQERDKQENSVLVPADSDIETVEDLEGKTIALGRGTSAQGLLIKTLAGAGLGLDDVEPNYMAPADGLAAFTSGAVDAWVVWDPFTTHAIQASGAREIAGGAPDESGLQFEIASSAALADDDRRALITDFVGRLSDGFAWAIDNPDAWGEAWAEESGLPVEVTTTVAKQKQSDLFAVNDEVIAESQALADLFFEAGELPEKIDFASVVEPGIVE